MTAVIEVTGLTKRYGGRRGQAVVDDIAFHVDAGEIFGILGPNGAGKTTAVECMEGLRRRDGGQVRILGLDPLTDRHRLHQRIGVQLQESQLQEKLKVREALELYASFYPNPADWRELLEPIHLLARAHRIALVCLPGDAQPDPHLAALCTVPLQVADRAFRYCIEGGVPNATAMLRFLSNALLGTTFGHELPAALPEVGIYRPDHAGVLAD